MGDGGGCSAGEEEEAVREAAAGRGRGVWRSCVRPAGGSARVCERIGSKCVRSSTSHYSAPQHTYTQPSNTSDQCQAAERSTLCNERAGRKQPALLAHHITECHDFHQPHTFAALHATATTATAAPTPTHTQRSGGGRAAHHTPRRSGCGRGERSRRGRGRGRGGVVQRKRDVGCG